MSASSMVNDSNDDAERVEVRTDVFDGSATTGQTIHDLRSVQHIHQTVAWSAPTTSL